VRNDKVYFGMKAKTKFWEMYKSERTFKDYEKTEEILDPRFAYLKQCKEMNMLPKAGMII
jgi:hypothetical protein